MLLYVIYVYIVYIFGSLDFPNALCFPNHCWSNQGTGNDTDYYFKRLLTALRAQRLADHGLKTSCKLYCNSLCLFIYILPKVISHNSEIFTQRWLCGVTVMETVWFTSQKYTFPRWISKTIQRTETCPWNISMYQAINVSFSGIQRW